MANGLSTQATKLANGKKLDLNEKGGTDRVAYFDYTVPAGNQAIGETVAMVTVPAGARFLGGRIVSEAMSTGAGAASVQIGDGTTANKFLDTTSIDAIAQSDFGNTLALAYGTVLAVETTFYLTVVTEAWLAGKKIAGHVRYTENY